MAARCQGKNNTKKGVYRTSILGKKRMPGNAYLLRGGLKSRRCRSRSVSVARKKRIKMTEGRDGREDDYVRARVMLGLNAFGTGFGFDECRPLAVSIWGYLECMVILVFRQIFSRLEGNLTRFQDILGLRLPILWLYFRALPTQSQC